MRLQFNTGAYASQSVIANAQRCLNLYPELNPQASNPPVPVTHYPTPGLVLLSSPQTPGAGRALYTASNGKLYAVIGSSVYLVSANNWSLTHLGEIAPGATPCRMTDNGLQILLVDGSVNGYTIELGNGTFATVSDPAFYGSVTTDQMDTFILLHRPGTPLFYITNALQVTPFNPLSFADKSGQPDPIAGLVAVHLEIWLIGTQTTEIWFNSGATDFPFERMPGTFVEHGCIAPYSIVKQDLAVFWLSQDKQGKGLVFMGAGYEAKVVSTRAMEAEFQTYLRIQDAQAYCYQQNGHTFYVLNFPSADKTWVYDLATDAWHERCYLDNDGVEHRHRVACASYAGGDVIGLDWNTGDIYLIDPATFTDNGQPIKRLRTFPHIVNDGKRMVFDCFTADVECGTGSRQFDLAQARLVDENGNVLLTDSGAVLVTEPRALYGPPTQRSHPIFLRCSNTRGASWSDPSEGVFGPAGDYLNFPMWTQLGMARDMVFELSWSAPIKTALNGAWVDITPIRT